MSSWKCSERLVVPLFAVDLYSVDGRRDRLRVDGRAEACNKGIRSIYQNILRRIRTSVRQPSSMRRLLNWRSYRGRKRSHLRTARVSPFHLWNEVDEEEEVQEEEQEDE